MFGKVSIETILFMSVSGVLSVLVPIGAAIYLGVKRRLNAKAILVGALVFIVFALVLERVMHMLVLGANPVESYVFKRPYLYMLYGGLAAGVFEETGRLLGFKYVVRVKRDESVNTGLSYGLGHGGIESVLLVGLTFIGNIVTAVMMNNGSMAKIIEAMPSGQAESMRQSLNSLVTTPSYMFLIGGVERLVAMVLQVALSLIVLKAVTSGKWVLFAAAIALHAVADFPAALMQAGTVKSVYVVELWALALAIVCAFIAWRLYRPANNSEAPDVPGTDIN